MFLMVMNHTVKSQTDAPKVVVGIVVDQFAYDFLYRYADNYSDGGFKKILAKGFSCENTNYNYVPTYTGPGHTAVYTGSVPAVHGIISNDWYDTKSNAFIYCASDKSVNGVGTTTDEGKMSPRNMLTTTICDELKLFNNMHSKVVGVALKDRGAILPAGHIADAAYWYDGTANVWVSSTYYMQSLPQWVSDFNAKNIAAQYLSKPWELFLSAEKYKNSTTDNSAWEGKFKGEITPEFPHIFSGLTNTETIKATPYGNDFTADFAKEIFIHENFGKDEYPDFLALSFSSTDYVGHRFGNYSLEIEDTYIRFDRMLADFLSFLDQQIGEGNYLLFITADHGVAPTPGYMNFLKIPSGGFSESVLQAEMEHVLDSLIQNGNWISTYTNQNIYLKDSMLKAAKVSTEDVFETLHSWLLKKEGIANAFLISNLTDAMLPEKYKTMLLNGINAKRSGDIFIQYEPGWMEMYAATGTTHGSFYSYDTHVPLLWYGWNVRHGYTNRNVNITDIAATVAAMLNIREPNGSIGEVITEIKKHD